MHAYIFILPLCYIIISLILTPSPKILILHSFPYFPFKSLTFYHSVPVIETTLFLLFGWQTPPPKSATCPPPAVVGDVLRQSR